MASSDLPVQSIEISKSSLNMKNQGSITNKKKKVSTKKLDHYFDNDNVETSASQNLQNLEHLESDQLEQISNKFSKIIEKS